MPRKNILVINQKSLLELPVATADNQGEILQFHEEIASSLLLKIKTLIKNNKDQECKTILASPIREEINESIRLFKYLCQELLSHYHAFMVRIFHLKDLTLDELSFDENKEYPFEIVSLGDDSLSFLYLTCENKPLIQLAEQSQQEIKRRALTHTDSPNQDDLLIEYLKMLPEYSPIYTVCTAVSDVRLSLQKPWKTALSVRYSNSPIFTSVKSQQAISSSTPLLKEAQEIVRRIDQEFLELQSRFTALSTEKDDASFHAAAGAASPDQTRKTTM
jgi:hypothetical protein